MSDQLLIESFLRGEQAAFNMLVYRWQKKIFLFACRYTMNAHSAQDITQETFIRAYKNLPRLQNRERFGSWLYQIALNLCKDRYKSKKADLVSIQELAEKSGDGYALPVELQQDAAASPDEQVRKAELIGYIQKALTLLPEEQRIVVVMKQYQGLKFSEIADILHEPVNTVKSRMYNGLSAIRKNLQSWHVV
jgi:RNA polymerase sigma-70 factor, ECF subfamily